MSEKKGFDYSPDADARYDELERAGHAPEQIRRIMLEEGSLQPDKNGPVSKETKTRKYPPNSSAIRAANGRLLLAVLQAPGSDGPDNNGSGVEAQLRELAFERPASEAVSTLEEARQLALGRVPTVEERGAPTTDEINRFLLDHPEEKGVFRSLALLPSKEQ